MTTILNNIWSTARDLWRGSVDTAYNLHTMLFPIMLVLSLLHLAMWWANIEEQYWIAGILWFATVLVAIWLSTRPGIIGAFFLGGAADGFLRDLDVSRGARAGLTAWYRLSMLTIFGFCVTGGLLVLLPWHQNPGAYWGFLIILIMLLTLAEGYNIATGRTLWNITRGFAVVYIVCFGWTLVDNGWKGDHFDGNTGQALYLMEPDGSAVYTDRTVESCAESGKGCFSSRTGQPLVPVTAEAAKKHGLRGWTEGDSDSPSKWTTSWKPKPFVETLQPNACGKKYSNLDANSRLVPTMADPSLGWPIQYVWLKGVHGKLTWEQAAHYQGVARPVYDHTQFCNPADAPVRKIMIAYKRI